MKMISLRAHRILAITLLLLAAVISCFFFAGMETARAEALYDLGECVEANSINLAYGDVASYPVRKIAGEDKYFKVVSYLASETVGSSTFSLITAGRVTATPGTYYMAALSNTKPSDESGNTLEGECAGILIVNVTEKALSVTMEEAALSKIYGEEITALEWDFLSEEDRDDSLEISFVSAGFASSASRGSYPISVSSVTKGGAPVTEYYDITVLVKETSAAAELTVLPKPVTIEYAEEAMVPFNSYLMSDGESVVSRSGSGVNGESVIAYYRMKEEAPAVLTVGASYEIECYRYEVIPSEGEAVSYAIADPSDYALTPLMTATAVLAKSGRVTLYQDESLIAAREGDPSYLYLPPSVFTYTYRDGIVSDYHSEIVIEDVTFYEGVTGAIRCRVSAAEGADIPAGRYPMTLNGYDCPVIEELILDESVCLTVNKRNVGAYAESDSAETAMGDSYTKRVTFSYEEEEYLFDLTADLTGSSVGSVLSYTYLTSLTDPNLEITFSEATVTVVKRSTGVSLEAESPRTVYYGSSYTVASLWLDHGSEGGRELSETVLYRYHTAGSSAAFDGLPSKVGNYVVICRVESELYEVQPLSVELTISKRPVAAAYELTSSYKAYGESFSFVTGSTVRLRKLYEYDVETGLEDRAREIAFSSGAIGGTILSSEGGRADAAVGEYPFDLSLLTSQYYDVKKAIVLDISSGEEVTKFVVVKAASPDAPSVTFTVSGREVRVNAAGVIRAERSLKSDMSSATSSEGTNSVRFTGLTYGETYYMRVRVEDLANYNAVGAWSEVKEVKVPFAKPKVAVSSLGSERAVFTADDLKNSVQGYLFQHRIGSGAWSEGLEVSGLRANTNYTISFRAKKGDVTGEVSEISIRTLRAPLDKEKVDYSYDREQEKLVLTSEEKGLEYRLLSSLGEVISDWDEESVFEQLQADNRYLLQIRYPETEQLDASDITEIEIDTHEVKPPFEARGFLSDWFLLFVGGGLLIWTILFIILFAKSKRQTDREELGGK